MWIETVVEMVKQNKDVQFANLDNVEEISTRKSGWGYIKIAIPNELAQRLLSKQDMNGGLLLFDKSEFEAIAYYSQRHDEWEFEGGTVQSYYFEEIDETRIERKTTEQ